MRSHVIKASRELETIRSNLTLHEKIETLVRRTPSDHNDTWKSLRASYSSTRGKQEFVYSASIIQIYGCLEKFAENCVADGVSLLGKAIQSHTHVSPKLRKNNFLMATGMLARMASGRHRGPEIPHHEALSLARFLENLEPLEMSSSAFKYHTANIRWASMQEMFSKAGFELSQSVDLEELSAEIFALLPEFKTAEEFLEDLARRRNEVSHGSEFSLLSPEILAAYSTAVGLVCTAVGKAVSANVAEHFKNHSKTIGLGRPDKVFQRDIIGFERMPCNISVGDYLLASTSGRSTIHEVRTIQSREHERISAPMGISAGLRVTGKLSPRARLFLLPRGISYSDLGDPTE